MTIQEFETRINGHLAECVALVMGMPDEASQNQAINVMVMKCALFLMAPHSPSSHEGVTEAVAVILAARRVFERVDVCRRYDEEYGEATSDNPPPTGDIRRLIDDIFTHRDA